MNRAHSIKTCLYKDFSDQKIEDFINAADYYNISPFNYDLCRPGNFDNAIDLTILGKLEAVRNHPEYKGFFCHKFSDSLHISIIIQQKEIHVVVPISNRASKEKSLLTAEKNLADILLPILYTKE